MSDSSQLATNPMTLLQMAIEKGIDDGKLEKLMGLHERWEASRAAEAFGNALAAFQSECGPVFKSRSAKTDKFGYKFASLDDVMEIAGPILAKNKISISFDTEHKEISSDNKKDHFLTVICRIRVGSYFEDHKFTSPVPSSLRASEPQQYGAALQYLKRYCLCAALNIVTTDKDTDAASVVEFVSQGNVEQMKRIIEEANVDIGRFLAWAQIDSLEQMAAKDFPKAMDLLNRKRKGD